MVLKRERDSLHLHIVPCSNSTTVGNVEWGEHPTCHIWWVLVDITAGTGVTSFSLATVKIWSGARLASHWRVVASWRFPVTPMSHALTHHFASLAKSELAHWSCVYFISHPIICCVSPHNKTAFVLKYSVCSKAPAFNCVLAMWFFNYFRYINL